MFETPNNCCNDFFVAALPESPAFTSVKRPRIGVDYGGAWAKRLLQFYINGNPFVSRRKHYGK